MADGAQLHVNCSKLAIVPAALSFPSGDHQIDRGMWRLAIVGSLLASRVLGFIVPPGSWSCSRAFGLHHPMTTTRSFHPMQAKNKKEGGRGGGQGFGSIADKTYGQHVIQDMIDTEGAMQAFFGANEEWSPLFRSIATGPGVPAMSFLGGSHGEDVEFTEITKPWTRLKGIPTDDDDRKVLAAFLDSMQQSLVDLPVNEATEEDELDIHFLEEGRRMLVISRFHVVKDNAGGSIENFDSLFSVCWSELAELSRQNEADTGSLILVPDYDLDDLRRFSDMNLLRPLQWLGMGDVFEVSSMQRDSPAIRLIHKLSDMPTEPYEEG